MAAYDDLALKTPDVFTTNLGSRGRLIVGCLLLMTALSHVWAQQDSPSDLERGVAALKAGDLPGAKRLLSASLEHSPGSRPAAYNLGLAEFETHDYLNAEKHFSQVTASSDIPGAQLMLGITEYRLQKLEKARTALVRYTHLTSADANGWMWLGIVQDGLADPYAAAASMEHAARLAPDNVDVQYHLGHIYLTLSQRAYEGVFKRNPGSWRVKQILAQADAEADRDDKAIAEYREALLQVPEDADLHAELGRLLWKEHDLDEAVGEFQRSLALDPENAETLYRLGSLQLQRQQGADAVALLTRARDLRPDAIETHFNLGRALALSKDDQRAEIEFEAAIAPDPDSVIAQLADYQLAMLYRLTGQVEKSKVALARFEDLHNRERREEDLKLQHKLEIAGNAKANPLPEETTPSSTH